MIAREEAIYRKALEYATQKHSGQLRMGGMPYITHPVAVAQLLRESGYGLDYQITALFHDLLEDTDATEAEIVAMSNDEVLVAVMLLTKRKGYDMREYVEAICKNPMAKAVKAADRLHNLQCALDTTQEFKRRYILETVDWYMDFSLEIPRAVKILAQTLEKPLTELSFVCEPTLKWKEENAPCCIIKSEKQNIAQRGLHKMNFVVVDNDKRDLNLLMDILARVIPGCQVQPFADPLLSAKYVCNNVVDAVFVATEMRPVDGLVLLRVLRTNKPDLPIVTVSSSEMERVDAIYAGATGHLLKPVSAELLSSLLKQLAI